jgi:HSP20 family protein
MSTLVLRRRDPFADIDALFRTVLTPVTRSVGFSPASEVSHDGEDAVVRIELPGLDAERDITVEVDRGHLVVRGERRDERADEKNGRTLREVRYGAFRRSFALPEHVTGDDVTASYDAGCPAHSPVPLLAGSRCMARRPCRPRMPQLSRTSRPPEHCPASLPAASRRLSRAPGQWAP